MSLKTSTDIKFVKGVGDVLKKRFLKLGISTVGDLLYYFPKRYEDWSVITPISEADTDNPVCIKATVIDRPAKQYTKSGTLLYKALISDGGGIATLVYFNNKYIAQSLIEGQDYLFYGKLTTDDFGGLQMIAPSHTAVASNDVLHPVYRQTEGLGSRKIEKTVRTALNDLENNELPETLPEWLITKYRLYSLRRAVCAIHCPKDETDMRKARQRLIFEELLTLQLGMLSMRKTGRSHSSFPVLYDRSELDTFYTSLPYKPTSAQIRCVDECLEDMSGDVPMNRLLQGDVGSGKTLVAAALIYMTVCSGRQCALMAPTEILAEQHAATLSKLLGSHIEIALLTGSVPASQKKKIKSGLSDGSIDLVIGTHAVISADVCFNKLSLVITDEQHRFGVAQRTALINKGEGVHTLVMSATPIPRTLGMIIYGDLDISILDEFPAGRKTIETYCVDTTFRKRVYEYVRKHLSEGRQGYVVCPLVEEGETDLIPAEKYVLKLKAFLPEFRIELLHGKMKPKDKDRIMREFADGVIDLLVATVVVEVGIDVPNAAIIVIENAERYGLSQLHQLRGRVGRGKFKSTCVLITDAQNKEAEARMNIMTATNDGFKIADEDLRIRGPGDFLGARQHGLPDLHIADIAADTKSLDIAGKCARQIFHDDPELRSEENSALRERIFDLFDEYKG